MKTRKVFIVLNIICLSIISTSRSILASQPVVQSFTLTNGIHIVSIHIADSNNVSIFSFLPMGLAADGPGQAQWSHLVEHLVIRTPEPLSYQQANAETLHDHMRLDFYGTVDNWQQGLSHHVRWIKGVPFTQQRLQAEKINVNSECDVVAKRFATHKFAMAAWAQGYRHGRKHAALKGDINKVTLSEIQKYRNAHLAVLNRVVICVIGGINVETLKPVITEKFAAIKNNAKTPELVELHPGNHKMTWDLNARHLVLTWPIPNLPNSDYPALMVAAPWLTMKCFSDPELKKMTGMVLAGADLTVPEGNFFYVSASLRPETSFDDVQKKVHQHLRMLRSDSANLPEIAMVSQQLSYQLTNLTDPAIVKAQAPPNISDAMIEGNIGLQWAMHDFRYGSHRRTLAQKLATVTANQIQQVARKYLTVDKCSTCTIRPEL